MSRLNGDASLETVFTNAGESDLERIQEKIKSIEGELDGLKTLEKALVVRLRGKPARGSKGASGTKQEASGGLEELVYDYIVENGSAPAGVIATALGVSPQAVGVKCSRSKWFTCDPNTKEWSIAKQRV